MSRFLSPALFFIAAVLITGCGQHIYYWERPGVGMNQFVLDHNNCLNSSDTFPWTPPNPFESTEKLNIRADWNSSNGIWASYVPYHGAEPVVVNSLQNDWTTVPFFYARCMKGKGYSERRKKEVK